VGPAHARLGAEVRPSARKEAGWMSPIEIDEQHDAGRPCFGRLRVARKFQGFLRSFVSPLSGVADLDGPPLQQDKSGQDPPQHLAPDPEAGIGLRSWPGWCDSW